VFNLNNLEQEWIDQPLCTMHCSDLRHWMWKHTHTVQWMRAWLGCDKRCTCWVTQRAAFLQSMLQRISKHMHMHVLCTWRVTSRVVVRIAR
jgi:hypothetical protein